MISELHELHWCDMPLDILLACHLLYIILVEFYDVSVHNTSIILPFALIQFVYIFYMFTSHISDLVYQLLN